MKLFVALALIVAVASADFTKPTVLTGEAAEIQEIIAAIQSPSTNPATAAALEAMLLDVLGLTPDPVAVVEQAPEPIAVGPAVIDFPLTETGELAVVEPSPVVLPAPVAEAAANAPLVQIIVNINQAQSAAVVPSPVAVAEVADQPQPITVVESAPVPVSPVQVVDVMPVVEPVQVVDTAPIAVEPVIIGTPIIPSPAVVLPDDLN